MSPVEALAEVVREVELHAARAGWDQPAQLFALVDTADLLEREPQLAALLGIEPDTSGTDTSGGLTPVEQETVADSLEELLPTIVWPPEVSGCAVVVEALTVPPGTDDVPADPEDAAEFAAAHPDREEARIVAAALRTGETLLRDPSTDPRRGRPGPHRARPRARPSRVVARHPRTRNRGARRNDECP